MKNSCLRFRPYWRVLFAVLFLSGLKVSASTVVYWAFDDGVALSPMNDTGNNAQVGSYDLSGNGYGFYAWDAVFGPSFSAEGDTPSGQGLAAVFNGGQDGYNSQSDFVNWSPQAWTIELSFRFDVVASHKTLIGKDGSAGLASESALSAFYLQTDGNQAIRLQYVSVSDERFILTTDFVPTAGKWYNIALRSDGRYLDILLDSFTGSGFESIGSWDLDNISNSQGDVDHSFKPTGTWTFGRGWYGNRNVDHITGAMDNIRYSDIRLADEQLLGFSPVIVSETENKTVLFKNDPTGSDRFSVSLFSQPSEDVVVSFDIPAGLDAGNGNGQSVSVTFTANNWSQPVEIDLSIADASVLADTIIKYSTVSSDSVFDARSATAVKVFVYDDSCGVWGYLSSDFNLDCTIDIMDFAYLAELWLAAETPFPLTEIAGEWLSGTISYDEEIYNKSIQPSQSPFYVDSTDVLNEIDPFVYGHFYEHIYHSANGGLWGELVWNRSFEMNNGSGGGVWSVENADEIVQSSGSTDVILNFGDMAWSGYEISLEARKDGGSEGFLVEFLSDDTDYYWLNIGGWGNSYSAIQKGNNSNRSTLVTNPLTVNAGQWYDIRIRCENGNIRVWVDGVEYFDYTDSSPLLAGYCGIGTWATQSRYRNISVTALVDSAILFSGLPTLPYSQNVCDNWQSFGSGTISRTSSDSRNDDYSIAVSSDGAGTGIIQDNFKYISQNYSGSLWIKGDLSAGVTVEFLDQSLVVIGQAQLGSPTASWSEYPFNITPSSATDNGYLRVTANGPGSVLIDQVSLMGQDSIDTGGYRADLLEAVDRLRAPVIRWPGGCFASAYYWKDGIGSQVERKKYGVYLWEDQDVNSYGTDEFLRMCEDLDIEPIIVVNIGILDITCGAAIPNKYSDQSKYLEDVMDWMEYCNGDISTTWGALRAANGHPEPYNVYYWEIDNETWAAGATAYAELAVEYAIAMKAKAQELGFADQLKLIACGGGDMNASASSWNGVVINTVAEYVDYISVHRYEDPGAFKNGPLAYENFLKNLHNLILNSANPQMEVYMSEWNAQSIDMRTGLHAGALLNVFERQGEYFTLGGPALFLRHVSATGWNNSFINFDHTGYFLAPNYIVMKLWWDHFAPYRLRLTGGDADLNVVATKSDDGEKLFLKIVNPDPVDKTVEFVIDDSFSPGKSYIEYVAPGSIYAENSLSEPDLVKVESKVIGTDGQNIIFKMPAYSAGVVTVPKVSD